MNASANQPQHSSPKEEYALLYSILEQTYKGFIDFEFRHGGFLALIIGWLATSERAQLTIANAWCVRFGFTVSIGILTVLHAIWSSRWYRRSNLSYSKLTRLNYVPLGHFESLKIDRFLPTSFAILHTALSVFICVFIWSMGSIVESILDKG